MRNLTFFLILLGLLLDSSGKTIKSNFFLYSLKKVPLKFLSKFTFQPGEGELRVRAKVFRVYLAPNNNEYEINNNPNSSQAIVVNVTAYSAHDYNNIKQNLTNNDLTEKKEIYSARCKIPFNGEWSEEQVVKIPVNNEEGATLFYIAATSLDKDPEKNQSDLSKITSNAAHGTIRLGYEIKLFNSNGSHFSHEESDLIYLFSGLVFLYGAYIFINTKSLFNEYRAADDFNYPLVMVLIAVFLEFFYVLTEFIHLWIYSKDGVGSRNLTWLSRISSIISQYIFSVILVLISWGWSIFYINVENFTCFAPFLILLGFFELLIGILARIVHEEEFRTALFLYFFLGVCDSFKKSASKLKGFFIRFGLLGFYYFIALPGFLIGSSWVSEYNRKKFITIGISLAQVLAMILLSKLFTLRHGAYYSFSYRSNLIIPSLHQE